jgi:hypothetical protein
MKKLTVLALALSGITVLNSCGVNQALIANHNLNSTQVQLSGNNFKVVDKVSGYSEVPYVLGIGGITRKQLFEKAYSAMMDKANMKNTSRAVINVITEEHVGGVPPFYIVRRVTVSGNVIEFTK